MVGTRGTAPAVHEPGSTWIARRAARNRLGKLETARARVNRANAGLAGEWRFGAALADGPSRRPLRGQREVHRGDLSLLQDLDRQLRLAPSVGAQRKLRLAW